MSGARARRTRYSGVSTWWNRASPELGPAVDGVGDRVTAALAGKPQSRPRRSTSTGLLVVAPRCWLVIGQEGDGDLLRTGCFGPATNHPSSGRPVSSQPQVDDVCALIGISGPKLSLTTASCPKLVTPAVQVASDLDLSASRLARAGAIPTGTWATKAHQAPRPPSEDEREPTQHAGW
jgi:hypothetical protein